MTERLLKAIQKGSASDVQTILALGDADVNKCGKKGMNALHLAAQANDADVMAVLLTDPTADVNIKDEQKGWSALVHGIASCPGGYGNTVVLKQLLDAPSAVELLHLHGATRDAVNDAGETALHAAAKEGAGDAVAALLQCGADVNARDALNRTPLHLALEHRETNLAHLLLQAAELDTTAADDDGNTPLHVAVMVGLDGFAEKLAARGFSQTAYNAAGQRATDIRVQREEAAQEKEERRRRQEEEDFEKSALTAFCRQYEVSEATAHLLHRRGFRALDDEFFSLDSDTLKKLCFTKSDRQRLEEGRNDHLAQIEKAKEDELRRVAEAEAQRQRLRRLLGIVLVVAAFVAIYMVLVVFISFFTTRN